MHKKDLIKANILHYWEDDLKISSESPQILANPVEISRFLWYSSKYNETEVGLQITYVLSTTTYDSLWTKMVLGKKSKNLLWLI